MQKSIAQNAVDKNYLIPGISNLTPAGRALLDNERGVLAAALAMGWTSHTNYDGQPGFAIPVQDAGGARLRFRALSKQARPKTRWLGKPGSYTPKYYYHPDIAQHVERAGGRLPIATGDYDFLTFHAIGCLNTVALTSETARPDDIIPTFTGWGARHIDVWLDNDDAGLRLGRWLVDTLTPAGFTVNAYSLAELVNKKGGDTSDLWQALKFDKAAFIAALSAAPLADLPPGDAPRPIYLRERRQAETTDSGINWDEEKRRWWVDVVLPHVERVAGRRKGKRFQCINPHHDDKNPSARISTDKNPDGLYVCNCGVPGWDTVAEWSGAPDFKTWLKDNRQTQHNVARHITPVLLNSTKRAAVEHTSNFEPRIRGDVTGHTRYMNELPIPAAVDLLLISDTGTGKTKLLSQLCAGKSVLSITHRVALSAALAEALDVENYKGLDAVQLRQLSRLTVCVDSISKLVASDGTVSTFDVVVLDEIEQLLQHTISSSTVRARRETVYSVLCQLVKQAGRVIAADAYAGAISRDWLADVRGTAVQVVTNTQARARGALTTYAHKSGLLTQLFEAVDQDAGTVVLASSSRNLAKVVSRHAAGRYGAGAVLAVHQHSTDDPAVKAFLKHPDQQIGHYRLVIYSPTVGSGVDIQTPVRAVFGVFLSEPLDAFDCQQMLNRCRNAKEVHLYVESREIERETDPVAIEQETLENARQTAKIAHFDGLGVLTASDTQNAMLRLYARLEAQRHESQNQLRTHVMRLATGYSSLAHDPLDNPDILRALVAQRAEINEADKARTLAAVPVDRAAYEALIDSGELTEEQRYGHWRWKIEQAAGQEITPERYDLLHSDQQRAALYLLADALHADAEDLKDRDRQQAARGLQDRRHYTRKVLLFKAVIRGVFGEAGLNSTEEIPADELAFRADTLLLACGDELRRLFGRRSDKSESPIAVLRWLLARFGLKLNSRQRGKARRRVYWLDQDSTQQMQALAVSCYARQQADRAEGVLKTGNNTIPAIPVLSTPVTPAVGYKPQYANMPYFEAAFRPLRR